MQRWLLTICLFLTLSSAQEALFLLPDATYTLEPGAVTLHLGDARLTYLEGLGWSEPSSLSAPQIIGERVYGTASLLGALGVGGAKLTGLRFGGGDTVRVVLDFDGLAPTALSGLETEGQLAAGETLRLELPALLLPLDLPEPTRGLELTLVSKGTGTQLELSGEAVFYRVFSVAEPTRLVLDLTPAAYSSLSPETRTLRPGVIYRRFTTPTPLGSSGVHVLEVAPGTGEFRVVGHSETPRTVSQLASGALAAINAGYFDTRTFGAIGLLKVDYGLLSLPSRSRASIGFGPGRPIIDRVRARADVRINGRLYSDTAAQGNALSVVTAAGQRVGLPTQGVILAQGGRVLANKVGPRQVPTDGFAVVYEADQRDLALVNEGDTAALELDFDPSAFASVRYAVEAGPLLIAGGRSAFDPATEAFRRGERILDAYTQQAAVGVRSDGTVLFVVATNMTAEDMVPLLLSLGASDAMRLDSGSSSTLVIDGEVVNRSSEREVVSAIVFVPYAN